MNNKSYFSIKILNNIYDFFNIIKNDLIKLYKNFNAAVKDKSNIKSKLLTIINHFSELLVKTKVFIISLVIFVPILISLFQSSDEKLLVIDEKSLSTCVREAWVSANTIPSKGISREKAESRVNLMISQNPKSSPDNVARLAYSIIKNDRKNGIKKLVRSQIISAINDKNSKNRLLLNAINAGLLICFRNLHFNLNGDKKFYIDLPMGNLDEVKNELRK